MPCLLLARSFIFNRAWLRQWGPRQMPKWFWITLMVLPFLQTLPEPVFSQNRFNFRAYQPSSIEKILRANMARIGEALRDDSKTVFGTSLNKYKVTGNYVGSPRKIKFSLRMRIDSWARALGIDNIIYGLFTHEIRLMENGKSYWLPVQKHLVPFMREDLSNGQVVDLFVVFIGVFRRNPVFLVNNFKKTKLHQASIAGERLHFRGQGQDIIPKAPECQIC